MNLTIFPQPLQGTVAAIPSKSQAHRALICAAFAEGTTEIRCPAVSQDLQATAACLNALGAAITRTEAGFSVRGAERIPSYAELPCGESGSTLRFLLPVAGALGVDARFHLAGRLPQRPLSPMWEELERMGCRLSRPTPDTIRSTGRLHSGAFTMAGNVSSQFFTGLLLAAALLPGVSHIRVEGTLESRPYVEMTRQVLDTFGVSTQDMTVCGGSGFRSPGTFSVEGDWSNGAFFRTAAALGSPVTVTGLWEASAQGDRAIAELLPRLQAGCPTLDVSDIPDLVPILAVAAGAFHGAVFTGIRRLRLKESDRAESTCALLRSLGGQAEASENTLTVSPAVYRGGTVDSFHDHRIAMAAAIAATVCSQPVTILGAECTEKSYPRFWEDYRRLGGRYEQYLR